MLHTSPDTLPVLQVFNKWNSKIVEDYNRYVETINIFYPVTATARHKQEGKGRCLLLWQLEHTDTQTHIEHFPSLIEMKDEIEKDPNIQITWANIGIFDGKGKISLHTDDDNKRITVRNPESKLNNNVVKQYRAHIPVITPEDCFFYHLRSSTLSKIKWTVNECFAFEKCDKHYVVNNSDSPSRVIFLCDFWMKDSV